MRGSALLAGRRSGGGDVVARDIPSVDGRLSLVARAAATSQRRLAPEPGSEHQHEIAVVGGALAARLVTVAHDADTREVRNLGARVAVFEAATKLCGQIEPHRLPGVERGTGVEDDRVLRDEGVALPVADLTLLAHGAPNVLEGVVPEPALPGDVHHRGRIALAVLTFVAARRQLLRAPLPAEARRTALLLRCLP